MRKESTIVVYDSSLAIAEEIASKLGGEPVSVQSLDQRKVENTRNFILGITLQDNGQLTPHWQYGRQTLQYNNLSGKTVAVFVSGSASQAEGAVADFCNILRKSGAHVVGQPFYTGSHQWNIDYWIASISPNL